MKKLAEGVTLEDGFIQPDALSYASSENKRELGLEIHSGKNRIVRRMFEALGYRVEKLDRVYFGGLTKKNLPRGKWRLLTEKEVSMLKMNAYE
jgi:23S rRNA pseudouridine2605 synthase